MHLNLGGRKGSILGSAHTLQCQTKGYKKCKYTRKSMTIVIRSKSFKGALGVTCLKIITIINAMEHTTGMFLKYPCVH